MDVGEQSAISLRKHLHRTNGLIYVVDSSDREKFELAREELHSLLDNEELKGVPLLVYANKLELNLSSVSGISDKLELNNIKNRAWFVQGACATTGDGLYEGLDWLGREFHKKFDIKNNYYVP